MKKFTHLLKRNKETFIKKCPNGGYCINPLCMFGCIDNTW